MKQNKWKTAWMIMLAVVLVLAAFPEQSQASDLCQEALEKCGVDAVISVLLGGWPAAAVLMSACINGYVFCQKYFVA